MDLPVSDFITEKGQCPSPAEGCRAQLPLVAVLNSAAVHIRVQVSMWTQVFISLRHVPRSMVLPYGNSTV